MMLLYLRFLNLIGVCKLPITLSDFSAKLKISSLSNNLMAGEVFVRRKFSAESFRLFLFLLMDKLRAANFLSCRRNSSLFRTGENSSKLLVHFSFKSLAGLLVKISISLSLVVSCAQDEAQITTGLSGQVRQEPGTGLCDQLNQRSDVVRSDGHSVRSGYAPPLRTIKLISDLLS